MTERKPKRKDTGGWRTFKRGRHYLVLQDLNDVREGQVLEYKQDFYDWHDALFMHDFRTPDGSGLILDVYDYDEIPPFNEIFELLDDNDPRIGAYRERYLANIYPCPYQEGKKYVALQNIQEIKKGKVLTYEGVGTSGHGERLHLYFYDWRGELEGCSFDTSQEKPDWKKLFRRYPFWNAWLGRF